MANVSAVKVWRVVVTESQAGVGDPGTRAFLTTTSCLRCPCRALETMLVAGSRDCSSDYFHFNVHPESILSLKIVDVGAKTN